MPPLTLMDRTRQKSTKAIKDLNSTTDQLNNKKVYRTLHPTKAEYTIFSSAYGAFSRINNILNHKKSLNKF